LEESPQWLHDLGQAFLTQQAHVMDTVQLLRRRAHAAGHLANTDQYAVYSQGEAIVVQPRTQIIYVRYYDPYVVYGPWWWAHYRPVYWRPWVVRPVYVSHGFFYSNFDWRHRHVRVVHRPVHVHQHHQHRRVEPGRWHHHQHRAAAPVHQHRTPEAPRQHMQQPRPAVQPMPAANAFSQQHQQHKQHKQHQQHQQHKAHSNPHGKQPHGKQREQREQRQNRSERGHRG
jgi:hypothetical protein